jgi:hypothetical protein
VGTAEECLHKWGLSRLDNLESPQTESQALGDARHKELERWLCYGKAPPTPGMMKVMEHFPEPGACDSEVYCGFLVRGPSGVEIVFGGWVDTRVSRLDYECVNSTVYDLKTLKDMRWRKTPAQLLADFQAALYAVAEIAGIEAAALHNFSCDGIVLKWVYAQLRANGEVVRAEPLDEVGGSGVFMSREAAFAVVERHLPLAEQMLSLIAEADSLGAAEGKALKLTPKNYDGCAAYGGCTWKKLELCAVPAGGGFMSRFRQEQIKAGVEVESQVLGQIETRNRNGNGNGNSNSRASETTRRSVMGDLGSRFGNKINNGSSGNGTSAGAAPKTVSAPAVGVPVAAPAEVPRAKVNGSASGAPTGAPEPAKGKGTLQARLQAIANPGAAQAVAQAVAAAPARSVGINPPDAAPEWTPEQQAAESVRISGGKVEPIPVNNTAAPVNNTAAPGNGTEISVNAASETNAAPARKRGRPRKNGALTAGVDAVVEHVVSAQLVSASAERAVSASLGEPAAALGAGVMEDTLGAAVFGAPPWSAATGMAVPLTVEAALREIDTITQRLLGAGHRREALRLLEAQDRIIQGT